MLASQKLAVILHITIAGAIFILCLMTAWHSLWVVSTHDHNHFKRLKILSFSNEKQSFSHNVFDLLFDVFLVAVFIIQHSCTTFANMSKFLPRNLDLSVLQRSIYNALTCIALQFMMRCWRPVDIYALWAINTSQSTVWWWFFTITHVFSWAAIYGEAIVMDLGELIGIKQVIYNIKGLPSPMVSKTPQLRRLYQHMRHGGFTALSFIMWFHPVMRLDRAILAILLTFYMTSRFKVDMTDHEYNKIQSTMKANELKQLRSS